jgi:hypothetical protein
VRWDDARTANDAGDALVEITTGNTELDDEIPF